MKKTTLTAFGIAAIVGVATLPISGVLAANDSKNTIINATVESMISLNVAANVSLTATPGVSDGVGSNHVTATVTTNNSTGYNLSIKDADSDTKLNSASASDSIAAHAATFTAASPLAVNTWGYRVGDTNPSNYAGVTAADVQIDTHNSTANARATKVTFGMKVDASKKAATDYTDTVVFTAVTK